MAFKYETEADTRANRIDPALKDAGWNVLRIREAIFAEKSDLFGPVAL